MELLLFAIIVTAILVAIMFFKQNEPKQPESQQQQQITHFDLLDNNGEPIHKQNSAHYSSQRQIKNLRYFCIKDKGYHVSVWPNDQGFQGIDYIEFNIAGITHGEHVDDHLGEFVANLEPEPTNPYDANAIKIVTRNGHRVGYVPKDMTNNVRSFTNLPCKCYCYIGINDGKYFTDCYISKNN